MVFISATRLHLRSPIFLPAFLGNVLLSSWQIINTPGFKGGQLLRDVNGIFWTLSAWDEQAAMKIYRNSGAHQNVMPRIQDWCDESCAVHWRQEDDKLPEWPEVHRRMVADGFFTKLSQPSPNHLNRDIPQPVISKGLMLRPRQKIAGKS